MNKTSARSSRDITLPRRLLTTDSLPEAGRSLLKRLGQIAPGSLGGGLALSGQGGTRLATFLSSGREARGSTAPIHPPDNALLTDNEAVLLNRAYRHGRSFTTAAAPPSSRGGPSVSGRSNAGTERCFVLPLRNRNGKFGAVLLRYAGRGPDASERALIKQTACAAMNVLLNLQRHELFKTLERSKQHWEAAFDALDALLYIHSPVGELLKVNRALAERLGVDAAELLRCPGLFHAHFPLCRAVQQTEMNYWRSATLDATFEATVTPVYDRRGQLIGCVHILRDVSELLRMEETLRRKERLAALGEMVSGIAHELNNPLRSILWYADRLCRSHAGEPLPEDRIQDMTRKIGRETERAAHIVQDLLSFARPQRREITALSLNDLVERTVELSSVSRNADRIDLRLCLTRSLPMIEGTFYDLQRVLMNLIQNAQHAVLSHQNRGCITITTTVLGDRAVLCISDNGPGISPEHRERLLDPFFTTKPVGEGTGLGLSICYGILQAHHAVMHIQSDPGGGASFQIVFPVCEATPPENPKMGRSNAGGPAAAESPAAVAFTHDPSACRIGILDDEPLIRETLMEILTEARFQVCCFSGPEQALYALKTERFDLLISDIKMPEMSGTDFYSQVESLYPDMASRMLFITGGAVSSAANGFFAKTGRPFLKKPFRRAELLTCIAELLKPSGE